MEIALAVVCSGSWWIQLNWLQVHLNVYCAVIVMHTQICFCN